MEKNDKNIIFEPITEYQKLQLTNPSYVAAPIEELAAKVFARSIPREKIPARIGTMDITSELIDAYAGHENLLKIRALHSPGCYRAWDALRLCILRKIDDDEKCTKVAEIYAPCDEDLRRRAMERKMQRDDERRRILAAKSRTLAEENEKK